jgi:hypothetical protein
MKDTLKVSEPFISSDDWVWLKILRSRNVAGVTKAGFHNSKNTDGVAAYGPGTAASYLTATKGEAYRRRRMLGSEGTAADPDRESCRFHQRNSSEVQQYKCLVQAFNP